MRATPRDPKKPTGLLLFLTMAVVIGIAALFLSVQNAWKLDRESDARLTQRINADLAICERINTLRATMRGLAEANDELFTSVIDIVFAPPPGEPRPDRQARIRQLREQMDPKFEAYRAEIAELQPTDCTEVTPGAPPTTEAP